jgi:PAS domain S-box-containing protein
MAQRDSGEHLQKGRDLTEGERDQFFTLSLDMLCISSGDGYFKWLNPAFTQTLGWTMDELLTHPYTFFVHPDDLNATLREVERQVSTGEKVFHFENRYRHKDGSWRVLSWKSTPQGELMYAVARDVTERNRLERALQETNAELEQRVFARTQDLTSANQSLESEISGHKEAEKQLSRDRRFLDLVIENIPGMLFVKDAKDLRFVLFNRASEELLGYSRDELIGKNDYDFFPKEQADHFTARDREVLASGKLHVTLEEPMTTRHKGVRIMNAKKIPVFDEQGQPQYLLGFSEDVTDLKKAQQQLQQAQKMQAVGQLTGGIAHDFNNLLGVIVGNLDLASERIGADPRLRGPIQAAMEGAEHGAELTKRLLAFSRNQVLQLKRIDLNESLPQIVNMLQRTLGEQIVVRACPSEGLWPCVTDPVLVEDTILNLGINARDAMSKGGTLTIETSNTHLDEFYAAQELEVIPGDYVLLAVTDTGSGIPADVLEHVFEPFFTTKGENQGTGLGLSMVYGFVKQSKGHIKIYSELGHGTTVKIYLPRAELGKDPGITSRTQSAAMPHGSEVILVVDDNRGVRSVTVNQLSDLGYITLEAENARGALDILEHHAEIALLFSDVIMPGGMSGYDLAREAQRRRPGLKVLLTSGYASQSMFKVPSDAERLEMINKPFRMRELATKLRQILESA